MRKIFKNRSLLLQLLILFVLMSACNLGRKRGSQKDQNGIGVSDSLRYLKPIFDSVIVEKDLIFAEVWNYEDSLENLHLDVYLPFEDPVENRPVILWVHGGGFNSGTKDQGYIRTLAQAFSKRGYVSISTDYRLRRNPGDDMAGTIDDAVNDVMKAIDWIRENSEKYGINKNFIILGGGSAGGILSTNLCYKDAAMEGDWDKSGLIAFINLWGSPHKDMMDKTIDKNDPPTIFIHGMADSIVPFNNCQWLSGELDRVGVKYEVFPIEGGGHTPIQHMDDIVENISRFLYRILTLD